ncbi:MAG: enoyl-CoA hydratase/isomerase family protein [Gammaproteobacteria bacterium]|nr:enoyl-CoA hydratase/isomerase family protein [Gammaproteobacteria bacterium]
MSEFKYLTLEKRGHVAVVTFSNPPVNFLGPEPLGEYSRLLQRLDDDVDCRAIVLAAQGKVFCAGADFSGAIRELEDGGSPFDALDEFYAQAMTLFDIGTPMVAAVQGAAIGAGLGLTLVADFRVASLDTTFSANFTRLGFHPGFGLTETLPRLVGAHHAELLFYTGRRIKGDEAARLGLVTKLVASEDVLEEAIALAMEIASSAPLAVRDTRATLRGQLAARVREANARELQLQTAEMRTQDFREGIAASLERREPRFTGL